MGEDLPWGKIGLTAGFRQNVGPASGDYGFGWLWGVEAGYNVSHIGKPGSIGLSWSVLWGRFDADDPGLSALQLRTLELSFGGRLRYALGEGAPRFVVLSGGVTLLRSSQPLPPDDSRSHTGPYAGLGVEQYLLGRHLLSFDARYGLISGGPAGLSLMLTVAWGS
jgi:hypothetical protein